MPQPITLYVLAVIFLSTLVRASFGFGEALIAVPLLAIRLPGTVAARLVVVVSLLIATVVVVQDWRHVELRSAKTLILASLPGIPLGLLLLVQVNGHVVKLILGVLILAFRAIPCWPGRHGISPKTTTNGCWSAVLCQVS